MVLARFADRQNVRPQRWAIKPVRCLATDLATALFTAAFAGDDDYQARTARMSAANEAREGAVGLRHRQTVQVDAPVDGHVSAFEPLGGPFIHGRDRAHFQRWENARGGERR